MLERRQTARAAPHATIAHARIAVLEDDAVLREEILLPGLIAHGFEVEGFAHPSALHQRVAAAVFDAVVLDIGLPDEDGLAVARRLRAASSIGIVVLSGRQSVTERIQGLGEAVDAWLAKPIEIEVVAATLDSVLRRMRMHATGVASHASAPVWQLTADSWCLLSPAGGSVALSRSERCLLERLFATVGETVSREQLMADLGATGLALDLHRLDMLIHRLRRKVIERLGVPLPLRAIRGRGYLLRAQEHVDAQVP